MTPAEVVRLRPMHGGIIEAYLDNLRLRNQRPATLRQRATILRAFARRCDLAAAEREQLEQILGAFTHPQTRSSYLAGLRGFYRWAVPALRPDDPTVGIPRPRVPRRLPRPIDDADLDRALIAADPRTRLWLLLGADAGLRACEVAGMHRDHVGERVLIPEAKGGDPALVPVTERLRAALDAWPAMGWMWKESGPLRPQTVSDHGTALLRACGIDATFHCTRHTYITRVARLSGGDAYLTAELARHKSLQTTMNYVRTDADRVSELLGRFPAA